MSYQEQTENILCLKYLQSVTSITMSNQTTIRSVNVHYHASLTDRKEREKKKALTIIRQNIFRDVSPECTQTMDWTDFRQVNGRSVQIQKTQLRPNDNLSNHKRKSRSPLWHTFSVPNSPYGLYGRDATFEEDKTHATIRWRRTLWKRKWEKKLNDARRWEKVEFLAVDRRRYILAYSTFQTEHLRWFWLLGIGDLNFCTPVHRRGGRTGLSNWITFAGTTCNMLAGG